MGSKCYEKSLIIMDVCGKRTNSNEQIPTMRKRGMLELYFRLEN